MVGRAAESRDIKASASAYRFSRLAARAVLRSALAASIERVPAGAGVAIFWSGATGAGVACDGDPSGGRLCALANGNKDKLETRTMAKIQSGVRISHAPLVVFWGREKHTPLLGQANANVLSVERLLAEEGCGKSRAGDPSEVVKSVSAGSYAT